MRHFIRGWVLGALISTASVFFVGCISPTGYPYDVIYGQASITTERVNKYATLLEATVSIQVHTQYPYQATGTVVDAEKGIILTCDHVIPEDGSKIIITVNRGDKYTVASYKCFPKYDLAILYIGGAIRANSVIVSKIEPLLGDKIVIIGNIYGLYPNSLSFGNIAGVDRDVETMPGIFMYQTDATIVGGNSGGPWLNMDGELISISSQVHNRTGNVSFGISLPDISKILQENQDAE